MSITAGGFFWMVPRVVMEKRRLLTRVEVLQLVDFFLDSKEKQVLQNFPQVLLSIQAEPLQVMVPQSEQRTAWTQGREARLIMASLRNGASRT